MLPGVLSQSVTPLGCRCRSACGPSFTHPKSWCYTYDACGASSTLGHWDDCSVVKVLLLRPFSDACAIVRAALRRGMPALLGVRQLRSGERVQGCKRRQYWLLVRPVSRYFLCVFGSLQRLTARDAVTGCTPSDQCKSIDWQSKTSWIAEGRTAVCQSNGPAVGGEACELADRGCSCSFIPCTRRPVRGARRAG